MKKFLAYSFAAMTLVGSLASCSQENDVVSPAGEEVNATFSLQLPQGVQSTRSYGDGSTAINLEYGVYEKNGTNLTLVTTSTAQFQQLQANVSVKLVTGRSYVLVFWGSDKASNAYTITWNQSANPTVAVDYTGIKQNDETRDAFLATKEVSVTGSLAETVYLYRPFAQINFGTNDLTEPSVTTTFGTDYAKLQTSLTTKAYSTLDLISGAVSDQTDVTFDLAGIPSGEEFPYEPNTYSYLSMDYLLVPQDKSMVDATFNVYSTDAPTAALNTLSLTNVPVQRNYQTNIFGQLLTSTHDYTVIIVPAFKEPDFNINPIPLETSEPTVSETDQNTYQVSTPEEWNYIAKNGPQGKNIIITQDIDFQGKAVTPIYMGSQYKVIGNGHTLKNIHLVPKYEGGTSVYCGLFGHLGVDISDLTIENAYADENLTAPDGSELANVFMGIIIGGMQDGCTAKINNVTIKNSSLKGVQSVAAICGYQAGGSSITITDCTLDGVRLTNYSVKGESGAVAGLVGKSLGTVTATGNNLTNVIIDGFYAPLRGANSIQEFVNKDWRSHATVTLENNTWGEGCAITKTSIGF